MGAHLMDGRLSIGGNFPPEPTPYEVAQAKVAELREECLLWLDGAPVTSQEQADGLAELVKMARDAEKLAETNRKAENEPFDAGKAEVQSRYRPLLADAERVKKALLAASTEWLRKVDAKQRAEAEAKRIEADRLANEARAAHLAANPVNLAEVEAADAALAGADRAARIASAAEKAVAGAKGATAAKAIGLRTYWVAEVTDPAEFARYLWRQHSVEYLEWLDTVARRMVATGKANLPGVTAREQKRAA